MEMLGEYTAKLNEVLIMKDDVNKDLYVGQLRFAALIQKTVDDAPELLNAFRQPQD